MYESGHEIRAHTSGVPCANHPSSGRAGIPEIHSLWSASQRGEKASSGLRLTPCRLVNQPDHNSRYDPLHEVGGGLSERQAEADVQVDVVVDDEGADAEEADEGAEAGAFDEAGAAFVEHGVEHGQDDHGHG